MWNSKKPPERVRESNAVYVFGVVTWHSLRRFSAGERRTDNVAKMSGIDSDNVRLPRSSGDGVSTRMQKALARSRSLRRHIAGRADGPARDMSSERSRAGEGFLHPRTRVVP